MIQLVPQLKILVAVDVVDFRKGVDTLAAVCRLKLEEDPFSGTVFVFRNRRGTSLKLLVYDGTGFWLLLKRFSKGKLSWWPSSADARSHRLAAQELSVLLYHGDPTRARFNEPWRKLP
jgi:transposase